MITRRILYWSPRALGILFALFISLFALDVFSEGYGLGEAVIAFLIHLVPTYIVVIALIIAWRWEAVGALLFAAVAALYWVMSRGETWIIPAPLLVVALLFLLNWAYGKRRKE